MNMAFLSSLQTRQILFYLTVICNLATCSFNATKQQDEETRLVSGCRYTYPDYINPYTPLMKIDMISCRNMLVSELPFYENVTKMELINVPQSVLNNSEIPKAIQSALVDLHELRWSKSHIIQVDSVPIASLVELDLSWNIVQHVRAAAFSQLHALRILNISHNNIETLPTNLFDERNSLKTLSLAYNQLKTLPRDLLDTLHHLEILDLSNNHLKHLEENAFRHATKLENLNLVANKLSSLSAKAFEPLSYLHYLSLENNQLVSLESGTFANQHELMVLSLGKNPLRSLPHKLLPDNNTLFVLTISHTKLNKIAAGTLQNLRHLRNLYLTDNRHLQNLHNDTFAHMSHLKVIHLQNNNFTQLPFSISSTDPDDLYLDGNPWSCDCTVQWIVFWAYDSDARRNSLRLSAYCNSTGKDLLETLHKMRCKPSIARVSPASYQSLESTVKLVCAAYANPAPTISWVTPNGLVYVESDSATDPILYHPAFTNHPHLPNAIQQNVYLHENGDLDIRQMSRDDAGEYVCVATNKMGESFAYTRLFVDPSIMQRIKTGSILCGLLWVNTFLLFSVVYLLIRRYSRRAKLEKKKQRMQENMDVYKSQQIARLRERCKNQMNRIKNNCSIQVEWMKDNYKESMTNSQDHRSSYLTQQYNEQMAEIREYYLVQMHKVRDHYEQQRNLILEFSVNRMTKADDRGHPSAGPAVVVKMENGAASPLTAVEEEDIYRYNDTMKNEIQKLTSLRNLHDVFLDADAALGCDIAGTSSAARCSLSPNFELAVDSIANGKVRLTDGDTDEKTQMLYKPKTVSLKG